MVRSLITIAFLLIAIPASAATIYMGAGETYTNLQAAMAALSAGDTLIIRDGTYTGSSNQITTTQKPPVAGEDSEVWTTIKAEHDGAVFFGDPGVNTAMLYLEFSNNSYWVFEGITWYGGTHMGDVSYVKFLRCGAGSNIVNVANVPFSNSVSDHLLYEDCHAWGGGRYLFSSYLSDHIVYRRCVGRTDAANTTHDARTEPIGGIAIYGTSYVEIQNCIIIDSDTRGYWVMQELVGALSCPNGEGSNVFFRGNIVLNTDHSGGGCSVGFTGVVRENTVQWDTTSGSSYGGTGSFNHNTIGVLNSSDVNVAGVLAHESGIKTVSNSILYDLNGDLGALHRATSDWNYFYANSYDYTGGATAGAHDVNNVDPLAGSLEYLPRIESGSTLDGSASDSGDIGATVLKKIGVSGTLYGETGYATTTDDNLWPFPNEDMTKNNFASYNHASIDGDRGFAAAGNGL